MNIIIPYARYYAVSIDIRNALRIKFLWCIFVPQFAVYFVTSYRDLPKYIIIFIKQGVKLNILANVTIYIMNNIGID